MSNYLKVDLSPPKYRALETQLYFRTCASCFTNKPIAVVTLNNRFALCRACAEHVSKTRKDISDALLDHKIRFLRFDIKKLINEGFQGTSLKFARKVGLPTVMIETELRALYRNNRVKLVHGEWVHPVKAMKNQGLNPNVILRKLNSWHWNIEEITESFDTFSLELVETIHAAS